MGNTSRRVEKAARARDERLLLRWLKTSLPATCAGPGCGKPLPTILPGTGSGRTRTWCSDACRQKAYRARKAAAGAAPPTPPAAPTETLMGATHSADDCILAVLNSPTSTAAVLDVVRRALHDGVLDRREYVDVQVALIALVEEMGT
jgi:hypothetical protein